MVDFENLRITKKKPKPIDPLEIFRRLPKPPGINDLYTSQAEVLQVWFDRREKQHDTVIKLHTGGGKTLVGLLIAQSTLNETGEPVLYLSPTKQLVNQTIEKAKTYGIPAVGYQSGQPINDEFINSNAIMVSTYKALFNGKSKFGLRGAGQPLKVSAIVLDDAHVAFSVVRESFTIEIKSEDDRDRYESLVGIFRRTFKEIDKLGKFDDIVSGSEYGALEVPYWAWREQLDAVREQLKSSSDNFEFEWPLLRDYLHMCHALITRNKFTITPILPFVNAFPTFSDASRRIYMSATIADDSEIIRTFDADQESVKTALTSRSLAGISERMIMIPDLMPFRFDVQTAIETLIKWTTKQKLGVLILVPSKKDCKKWSKVATVAENTDEVERHVTELQTKTSSGPVVFANRYDGIDLPGDTCRLLIMDSLPKGTSDYEIFRASALYDSSSITRMLAQRIEQGIGRGARGSGDHCVVLLASKDLASWISKDANFRFLTSATKAQIEIGMEISKEVKNQEDLKNTISKSFDRDNSWTTYHAETLSDLIDEEVTPDTLRFSQAAVERKAFNLWQDSYYEKAISTIEKEIKAKTLDSQERGWMEQLAARIADSWGNSERAEDFQHQAYASNRNLLRPKVLPPYRPLTIMGAQEKAITQQIGKYSQRRGFLIAFEEVVIHLNHNASSNQFEQALVDLARMIGFSAERHDTNGEGPDVLWILPSNVGFVIEAKSRKKEKKALTKDEHGQLLVAAEWFKKNYPQYNCVRVSVHPKNLATKAAVAGATHALTYEKIAALISDARALFTTICESQLPDSEFSAECSHLLAKSNLSADRLIDSYLILFKEKDPS